MYERFTDRARKVMQLANQEAQRLNHEYIGTEHILLGLVKEGIGTAAAALSRLAIDVRKIRMEVERFIQAGPDTLTMGRLPQTPRAQKALEYAVSEAQAFNHNYVGTEHILLGLIAEGESIAARVLTNLGLTYRNVRDTIAEILSSRPSVSVSLPTEEGIVVHKPMPPDVREQPQPTDPQPEPQPYSDADVLRLANDYRLLSAELQQVACKYQEIEKIRNDVWSHAKALSERLAIAKKKLEQYLNDHARH